MTRVVFYTALAFLVVSVLGCAQNKNEKSFDESPFKKIAPLYLQKSEPKPGDWLYDHPEKYQSFEDYVKDKPVRPDKKKNKIYVLPLCNFSSAQDTIVNRTISYLKSFYGLEVVKMSADKDSSVYKDARNNPYTGNLQLYTPYILHKVLQPKLPDDGVVMIGLTAVDLYPDKEWNYVFGQALLSGRVGVWSMNRFGDPSKDQEAFNLCFSRTIKTAAHEIGHMFGIDHCTKYECCMNGSNNLPESDRAARWFCCECLQKICWNSGYDIKTHLTEMEKFWNAAGAANYEEFYKKNLDLLAKP